MNKDKFFGELNQFKGKIKEQWGKLTDDDLTRIEGKKDQFVALLQKKYGYSKEKAEQEVDSFCNEYDAECKTEDLAKHK